MSRRPRRRATTHLEESAAQQAQDAQFAAQAQQWAEANCVKAHGNAGEGAVLGGLFGAVIGSGLAGRGSHGVGALAGAAVGAGAGAAIASSTGSNATSPGCPPGYVLRDGRRAALLRTRLRLCGAGVVSSLGLLWRRLGVQALSVPRVLLPALLWASAVDRATLPARHQIGAPASFYRYQLLCADSQALIASSVFSTCLDGSRLL